MSNALERAFQTMLAELDWIQRIEYDVVINQHCKRPPESPIEEAVLAGLVHAKMILPGLIYFGERRPDLVMKTGSNPWAQINLQQTVGDYRVDFLIDCYQDDEKKGSIVIECDGHNFHERTKEQAARDRSKDRWLTANGYTVMRFTGSEIYRDLSQVVSEIINALPRALGPRE